MLKTVISAILIIILGLGGYMYYEKVKMKDLSLEDLAYLVQDAEPKRERSYKIAVTSPTDIKFNWYEEDNSYKLTYGNYSLFFEGERVGTQQFDETLLELNMTVTVSKTGQIKFYYKETEVPVYYGE